jgi:Holliday junction resolvase RusA-like endonuclease
MTPAHEATAQGRPLRFTVEGVPRPKARARRGAGGRWYTPQATKAYEEAVGWAARAAGVHEPCDGGVRLDIVLWMPDRRRRDLDNCAKSICDGLNGIVYLDDSQIIELTVRRGVDRERPRAGVTVEGIDRHDVGEMCLRGQFVRGGLGSK